MQSRLAKFVLVRLWINGKGNGRWRELLEHRFGTSAIPLYVALRSDGSEIGRIDFPGGRAGAFKAALIEFLDEALEHK